MLNTFSDIRNVKDHISNSNDSRSYSFDIESSTRHSAELSFEDRKDIDASQLVNSPKGFAFLQFRFVRICPVCGAQMSWNHWKHVFQGMLKKIWHLEERFSFCLFILSVRSNELNDKAQRASRCEKQWSKEGLLQCSIFSNIKGLESAKKGWHFSHFYLSKMSGAFFRPGSELDDMTMVLIGAQRNSFK